MLLDIVGNIHLDINIQKYKISYSKILNDILPKDPLPTDHYRLIVLTGNIIQCGNFFTMEKIYTHFFKTLSDHYHGIIYVAGNHEFYDSDVVQLNTMLRYTLGMNMNIMFAISKPITTTLMNSLNVVFKFHGNTLWSQCDLKQQSEDFEHIKDVNSHETYLHKFTRSIEQLEKFNEENKLDNKIIVTCHSPYLINNEYMDNINNKGFMMSDLEYLMTPKTQYWIHGRTPTRSETIIGNTIVVSNSYGLGSMTDGFTIKSIRL